MFFRNIDQMSVIEIDDNCYKLQVDWLKEKFSKKNSLTLYILIESKLFALISFGDYIRAIKTNDKYVYLNRSYISAEYGNYYDALNIFKENISISAIPVLKNNCLIGEYIRWDDYYQLLYTPKHIIMNKTRFVAEQYKRVYLVIPSNYKSVPIYEEIYESLIKNEINISLIEFEKYIDNCDKASDYFEKLYLFLSEEDFRICRTQKEKDDNYCIISRISNDIYLRSIYFKCFKKSFGERIIFVGSYKENKAFSYKLHRAIYTKNTMLGLPGNTGKIMPQMYSSFFGERCDKEYADNIASIRFRPRLKNGYYEFEDENTTYYKVKNGCRVTIQKNEGSKRTVWFYGKCLFAGPYVEDKNTLPSLVAEILLRRGNENIRVVNRAISGDSAMSIVRKIMLDSIQDDDIIIVQNKQNDGLNSVWLGDLLNDENVEPEWFVNAALGHCNEKVYEIYAEGIADEIEKRLCALSNNHNELYDDYNFDVANPLKPYIDMWQSILNKSMFSYEKVGAIVMNCNPFTKGHRYLVETALEYVDALVLFVVEENESFFSFDLRFASVINGTADLKNVFVLPSGEAIISKTTFPQYFMKVKDDDIYSNMEYDITVFASEIAPYFNIKWRFVGEEPFDEMTKEYNRTMERVLPKYGINFVEIKRIESDSKAISATSFRKLLSENRIEEAKKLVPTSTSKILFGY